MEVKAQLRGLRIAPRKVRLVVGLIKKKDVGVAIDEMTHLSNRASLPVRKLIDSAIANAENNFRMVRSNLYVKNVWVDEGIKLRRWHAKGFGRGGAIQKKSSHINIILDERVAGMRAAEPTKKEAPKPVAAPEGEAKEGADVDEKKTPSVRPASDAPKPTKGLSGFGKKLFRRKSI